MMLGIGAIMATQQTTYVSGFVTFVIDYFDSNCVVNVVVVDSDRVRAIRPSGQYAQNSDLVVRKHIYA